MVRLCSVPGGAGPEGCGARFQPRRRLRRGGSGAEPRNGAAGTADPADPAVPARPPEVRPLDGGETWPPLGVVPVPADVQPHACGELRPGETLFLHTDGAEDARNPAGAFFPCGASSQRHRHRARPRGWSRACMPLCSGTPAGDSPTMSPCWCSGTTGSDHTRRTRWMGPARSRPGSCRGPATNRAPAEPERAARLPWSVGQTAERAAR
ncbi:SpoIIE family protein phosphatase [Streptomyces sp. MS1.HAVA.3]|uniref:SpoIIE family protein phosphatase n=1 Tax=Streptomyces caledonius TaxID=3134107 RepID=A0ABU8UCK2_9ACTN